MPRAVLDATVGYPRLEAEIGGYEAADREAAAIERFYGAAAELLGCDAEAIAFVENATRAWHILQRRGGNCAFPRGGHRDRYRVIDGMRTPTRRLFHIVS